MEFVVLNEILTSTVAQVFPDVETHSSMFSEEYLIAEESKYEGATLTATNSASQVPIHVWVRQEGSRRLEESFQRLKLDNQRAQGKELISFNLDELNSEKRNVKNELKHYDSTFEKIYGRLPNRTEKEPMRPLYMYYKKLKQAIAKKEQELKGNPSNAKQTSNSERNRSRDSSAHSTGSAVGSLNVSGVSALSTGSDGSRSGQATGTSSSNRRQASGTAISTNQRGSGSGIATATSSSTSGSSTVAGNGSGAAGSGSMSLNEVKRLLEELRNERSELRVTLHNFQSEFSRTHNRKIRYHKDIAPVENEYKRYKEVKSEIAKYETIVESNT